MLKEGKDPKDKLIADCTPHCIYWKEKLTRCEKKLEKIIKINPTKSCLYPMRDWVTCVEACVRY
jgi:ubiquinol-cytochrome c reductase subunit 6